MIFGIALGVCMLASVLSTNESLVHAFEDMVDRVTGQADLTVTGTDSGIPGSLTKDVTEVEGVEHAAAMLEVITRPADGKGGSLLVLGVDFLGDTFFLPFASEEGTHQVVSDPLAFVNDPTAVLITKKLAETRGLSVGDPLSLITSSGVKEFRVKGLLEDRGPAASFGGQVVVMFIDAAQVSFGRGYAVDRIDVALAENASPEEVKARISKLVEGTATVEEPRSRTRRLASSLWAFRNGLHMTGSVALAVCTFLIFNAVSVSVAQRRREVGTLRALGVTRGRCTQLFCVEALLMAVIGVAVGLALTEPLARVAMSGVQTSVSRFVLPIHPADPELTWSTALLSAAAGFFATLVAAYLPARATSRIDPAEALRATRATSLSAKVPHFRLALLGIVVSIGALIPAWIGGEQNGYLSSFVMIAGATLLVPLAVKGLRRLLVGPAEHWFGIPARLALDNVERSLARSAITVIALMFAVSMSMSVGAWVRSFEQSILQWTDDAFPADAVVTAGSPLMDRLHVAMAPSELEKLEGIPGLKSAVPVTTFQIDVGDRRIPGNAIDTRRGLTESAAKGRHRQVLAGPSPFPIDALYEKPRILVAESTAHREHLKPGDTLLLKTPTGARAFEVYAVVVDYSSNLGWLLMDRRWFIEYWGEELLDGIDLYFEPGADPERVAQLARERLGATPGIFVNLHSGLRNEIRGAAESMFAYAKAPEWITLIVALMGVMGTMLAVVIDRIREVGMLRAIGATRAQVAASLVAEAAFLGLSAALCGVIAGVPMGIVILKVVGVAASGWSLPYSFPTWTAVRMSLLVMGAAGISGFLPGRRAARLDPKEALSYE